MTETNSSREGFVIDEATHDIYRKLAKEKDINALQFDDENSLSKRVAKDDPLSIPFSEMKDVFIWAACLGFQLQLRKRISGKRRVIFRWTQCDPRTDVPILRAIAIAETSDVNVLLNQGEIMNIVEEYANGGIHELRANVLEGRDLPLWNLVSMIQLDKA